MPEIVFKKQSVVARFYNPLKKNKLTDQKIEIRFDPLLGHQSIFNPGLHDKKAILFPDTDEAYIDKIVADSRPHCFLCNGKWKDTTPSYPENIVPSGRLTLNSVALFPNLFPLSAFHAVVMLGEEHYRALNAFSSSLIEDALSLSLQFIKRCYDADPEARYFTINANYLLPAGSSVVHPHFQILGGAVPTTHHRLFLQKSDEYAKKTGSCFWKDLASTEKMYRARWIGEIGEMALMTGYSPLGQNEVIAIWPSKKHFGQWSEKNIKEMADGLSRILLTYHELKHSTFNFSCFSGALDGSDRSFRCLLSVITRQNMTPHYRTDDYYYQKILKNEIILRTPEELATKLRKTFE